MSGVMGSVWGCGEWVSGEVCVVCGCGGGACRCMCECLCEHVHMGKCRMGWGWGENGEHSPTGLAVSTQFCFWDLGQMPGLV